MENNTLVRFFAVALLSVGSASFACAQYTNQYPQPYNSGDPQNYAAPASQAYGQQGYPQQQQGYGYQQQQGYAQQQQGYAQQQNGYPQQQQNGQPYSNPGAGEPGYGAGQNPGNYDGQQLIQQAPPELPDYAQPEAPGDGYEWTPGYWAYGAGGYFWVPGTWMQPPYQGALWTPGYWGSGDDGYFWNTGYWDDTVGFYGGINYGFGYFGSGFYGGYWNGGRFFYNRAYWNGGRGRYSYNQPFRGGGGVIGVHPGGRSFAAVGSGANEFRSGNRGGAYTQQGFTAQANGTHGYAARGYSASGYSAQGYPAQGFSGVRQPYAGNALGTNQAGRTSQPIQNYGGAPYNRGFTPAGNGINSPSRTGSPQSFGVGGGAYHAPAQSYGGGRSFSSPGGGGNHAGGGGGHAGGGGHR